MSNEHHHKPLTQSLGAVMQAHGFVAKPAPKREQPQEQEPRRRRNRQRMAKDQTTHQNHPQRRADRNPPAVPEDGQSTLEPLFKASGLANITEKTIIAAVGALAVTACVACLSAIGGEVVRWNHFRKNGSFPEWKK